MIIKSRTRDGTPATTTSPGTCVSRCTYILTTGQKVASLFRRQPCQKVAVLQRNSAAMHCRVHRRRSPGKFDLHASDSKDWFCEEYPELSQSKSDSISRDRFVMGLDDAIHGNVLRAVVHSLYQPQFLALAASLASMTHTRPVLRRDN